MASKNQQISRRLRHQARLIVSGVGVSLFLKAQNRTCPVCGEYLSSRDSTIDHVFPLYDNRENFGNLLLCHYACNQKKAGREPTEGEIAMLEMVNYRLGYDNETKIYSCRQSIISSYNKLMLWLNELRSRNESSKEIDRVNRRIIIMESQIKPYLDWMDE